MKPLSFTSKLTQVTHFLPITCHFPHANSSPSPCHSKGGRTTACRNSIRTAAGLCRRCFQWRGGCTRRFRARCPLWARLRSSGCSSSTPNEPIPPPTHSKIIILRLHQTNPIPPDASGPPSSRIPTKIPTEFLDHKLWEFAATLPPEIRFHRVRVGITMKRM
jgi:hypothetical protein